MVAFVVADEMYEKVENGDLVMEAKELDSIEKPVWDMFVCLFVSIQSTTKQHQKCQKKQDQGV